MVPTYQDSSRRSSPAALAHNNSASTMLSLWAKVFIEAKAQTESRAADVTVLFYEMVVFFIILLVGYADAWGKGIFRYD